MNYACAAWAAALALAAILGPRAITTLLKIDRHATVIDADFYSRGNRVLVVGIGIVFAFLAYLFARGLWKLSNWARSVLIGIYIVDLLPDRGSHSSTLWPISFLVPNSPTLELLSRLASFALVLYLFSPTVRTAFGVTTKGRAWQYVATVLALVSLGVTFSRSGPELNAIKWHWSHGNQITVNGVTFPIYSWYAPVKVDGSGFEIHDKPGPLRPKDAPAWIIVSACKRSDSATVEQLVEREIQEYESSHYTALSKLHIQVGKQSLDCMQEAEFEFARSIYCYGDGPISSIHFMGGERPLRRFEQMMAQAH